MNIQKKFTPATADHGVKPTDNGQITTLIDALRDAARWLESAGDTCNLQSLRDAAARAQATLAAVQS